mmetsp:Transcript_37395/g.58077  ORF Transcript_37395/g.58077 Transcript_37395/m.58077 type:complete len:217 (+) Transcript_37395:64-714(+)
MNGPVPTSLAAFLGEAPTEAALRVRRRPVASVKSETKTRASDDSSSDSDSPPCCDTELMNECDDNVAPFSNPAPVYLPQFDASRKNFDCLKPTRPIAEHAPKIRNLLPKAHAPTVLPSGLQSAGGQVSSAGCRSQIRNNSLPNRACVDIGNGSAVGVRRRCVSQDRAFMQTLTPEPGGYASFLRENFVEQGAQQGSYKSGVPSFAGKPRYRFGGRV